MNGTQCVPIARGTLLNACMKGVGASTEPSCESKYCDYSFLSEILAIQIPFSMINRLEYGIELPAEDIVQYCLGG